MVKTRVKKTIITGVTSEQVEAALSEFSQADSRIQKITAEMELKITAASATSAAIRSPL